MPFIVCIPYCLHRFPLISGVKEVAATLPTDMRYHGYGEKILTSEGGELFIEQFGFRLTIPPGALEEGSAQKISLKVLTEVPEHLSLGGDELMPCFGFQCIPHGLVFKKSARLTIPHCAKFVDTSKVEIVMYTLSCESDGKLSFLMISVDGRRWLAGKYRLLILTIMETTGKLFLKVIS